MKLYKTFNGYTVITDSNYVYELIYSRTSKKYLPAKIGKAGSGYQVNGQFLKDIPNKIKRIVFKLNKK